MKHWGLNKKLFGYEKAFNSMTFAAERLGEGGHFCRLRGYPEPHFDQ